VFNSDIKYLKDNIKKVDLNKLVELLYKYTLLTSEEGG
jgi:hypothetical protein